MSNVLKSFLLTVVVGGLLWGNSALAAGEYIPQCRLAKGTELVDCPETTVDEADSAWHMRKGTVDFDWTVDTLNASDVESSYVGADNGYFTNLTVANTLTLDTLDAQQLNTQGLYVAHDAIIDGNLDIVGYIKAATAEFTSLVLRTGGSIAFWDNPYASISAMSTGLKFVANQILTMTSDGKASCDVSKNLTNGGTRWEWTDNSGVRQSATSLGGVPTQCLATP